MHYILSCAKVQAEEMLAIILCIEEKKVWLLIFLTTFTKMKKCVSLPNNYKYYNQQLNLQVQKLKFDPSYLLRSTEVITTCKCSIIKKPDYLSLQLHIVRNPGMRNAPEYEERSKRKFRKMDQQFLFTSVP